MDGHIDSLDLPYLIRQIFLKLDIPSGHMLFPVSVGYITLTNHHVLFN